MKRIFEKGLSLLLVSVILLGCMPAGISAAAAETPEAECTVYYVKNGGEFSEGFQPVEAESKGTRITLPGEEDISRPGYEFEGWYDNANFTGKPVTKLKFAPGEQYVYASWKQRYYSFTIPDKIPATKSGTVRLSADMGGLFEEDELDITVSSANGWVLSGNGKSVEYTLSDSKDGEAFTDGSTAGVFDETGTRKLYYKLEKSASANCRDRLTFGVSFVSTTYDVTFVDGTERRTAAVRAGTEIGELPVPESGDRTFVGWCYDSARSSKAASTDTVTGDITLYALYTDMQELYDEKSYGTYAHAYEQGTGFSVSLTVERGMTLPDVLAGIEVINATYPDEKDFFTVTGSATNFTVSGKGGFEPGCNYRLILKDDRIGFTEYAEKEEDPREYDFSIKKSEVVNAGYDSGVKYIPVGMISSLTVNGKKFSEPVIGEMIAVSDGSQAEVSTDGSFIYTGGEKLIPGDTVAVFSGDDPRGAEGEIIASEATIAFISVVSVDDNGLVKYCAAAVKDVLFMPDVIPVSVDADTDGDSENNILVAEDSWFAFQDGRYEQLGLDVDTTVDPGDFIVFYEGELEDGDVNYVRITEVSTELTYDGVFYTIVYEAASYEEVLASMDTFYSRPVTSEEFDKLVDKEAVLDRMIDAAVESGFAEKNAEYLAQALIESDGFMELLEERGLETEWFSALDEAGCEAMLTEYAALEPDGKTEAVQLVTPADVVEVEITKIVPDITSHLLYFDGLDGVRASLEIEVKITVHLKTCDLVFTVTGKIEQELRLTLGVDAHAEWDNWGPIPYISDYVVSVNTDVYEYTGLGVEVNFATVTASNIVPSGRFKKIEKAYGAIESVADKMETLKDSSGKVLGTEEDELIVFSIAEKYATLIETAEDNGWADLIVHELITGHFKLLYGAIDVAVGADLVLSSKTNITIGADFGYACAKRYVFTIYVFDGSVTNECLDLEPEMYKFDFYAMGTIGIRAGVQLRVAVGIIDTRTNSVAIHVRLGAYLEMDGYFYYSYEKTKMNGTVKVVDNYAGAMYFELGIFLNINFIAQAGNNKLSYSVELYDHQWPLLTLGDKKNIIGFAYDTDDIGEIELKHAWKRTYLPENLYELQYLDLQKGANYVEDEDGGHYEFFKEYYPYSEFDIQITNDHFTFDPYLRILEVNTEPGRREEDGELIITYTQPLALSKNPIQVRVKLHWDNLADGYTIAFDSRGGSYVPIITGRYGMKVTAPEDPVRSGYEFTGWYRDPECTKPYTIPEKLPDEDVVVYAGWKETEISYTVEHYKENLSGVYELAETDEFEALTGSKVTPEAKKYTGFRNLGTYEDVIKSDGSTVFKYYYARNTYTAEFRLSADSREKVVKELRYEEKLYAPSFGMTGYDFAGWDRKLPDTMPAEDIVFTGSWTPGKTTEYKVAYYEQDADGRGLTCTGVERLIGETGSTVTASAGERAGFITPADVSGVVAADGSLVLRLDYYRNEYTVTFVTGEDATECEPKIYRYGATLRDEEKGKIYTPVSHKADYGMTWWYLDEECTVPLDDTMPMRDVTVYAGWKKGTAYTVNHRFMGLDGTFDNCSLENGSMMTEIRFVQDYEDETAITPPVLDESEHIGFKAPDTQTKSVVSEGSEPVVFTYDYSRNRHVLRVELGYDNKVSAYSYFYDYPLNLDPGERTGYAFEGWTFKVDGEILEEPLTRMPDSDLTVTANWSIRSYYVYIDYANGSEKSSIQVVYGTALNIPAPERNGYDFIDWSVENGQGVKLDKLPAVMPAYDLYITATWNPTSYDITYVIGGDSLCENDSRNMSQYTIEMNVTIYPAPDNDHYTFQGWMENGKGEPAKQLYIQKGSTGNRSYTAKWQGREAVLTLEQNGATTNGTLSTTVRYGDSMPVITPPKRNGYEFLGYYTGENGGGTKVYNADGTPAAQTSTYTSDTTFYANWKVGTLIINYVCEEQGIDIDYYTSYFKDVEMAVFQNSNPDLPLYASGGVLLGWTDEKGSIDVKWYPGEKVTDNLDYKFTGKVTLYAVWMYDYFRDGNILTYEEQTDNGIESENIVPSWKHSDGWLDIKDGSDWSTVTVYIMPQSGTREGYENNTKFSPIRDSLTYGCAMYRGDLPVDVYRSIGRETFNNKILRKYAKSATVTITYETQHVNDGQQLLDVFINGDEDNIVVSGKKTSNYDGKNTVTFTVNRNSNGVLDLDYITLMFSADGRDEDEYYVKTIEFTIKYNT